MWSNPHDEYAGANPNKPNSSTPKASRQRTVSKNKRPQRPQFETNDNIDNNTTNNTNQPTHKFRGRGRSNKSESKKPNPWAHAHDEYANKKSTDKSTDTPPNTNKSRTKSPKQRRPVRIRFETTETNNTGIDDNTIDDDNHPEEKSNRPLNIKRKRPTKKKPNYVNAANIHAQQFHSRSGYRAKPLPPNPNRKTNQQRMTDGQANFEAMIKQAATMEGLDKSDIRVQRMIQRLGDQMSEVTGFNRFLQNKDEELSRVVSKQEKRKKQMDKVTKNINKLNKKGKDSKSSKHKQNASSGSGLSDPDHYRKGSVKDMAAAFERRGRSQGRRQRNKTKDPHRNALKLPNTKSHRRRVSSQFNIQAINEAINAANYSKTGGSSPFIDDNTTVKSFPNTLGVDMINDNASDISDMNLSVHAGRTRTASHGSRGSFSRASRQSAVPSVIMMKGPQNSDNTINTLVIQTGTETPQGVAVNVERNDEDPLSMLINILKCEPQERTEDQIDILVGFFENYQIMTEDVDTWSGKATFRSFIQQTRYRYVPITKHIFREGDDGDVFYFVLRGNVSVLVDDASTVHTSSKRHLFENKNKKEIHVVEDHHVFGEIAMFNQGKRSATCVAKTETHLAYWDRTTYDEFIRPMKELKNKAQKILRDKSGNMLSEDQLIEKAAMFLDDAMHGRELKMHRNGPWPRRIHKLINHKYFNYCLVMVSMLWLSLIFIEPPSYYDSISDPKSLYYYRIMPLIAFEWFVFLIFFGECLLRFYSFGSSWFFTIDLHIMRVVLLLIFFIDLIITCIQGGNSPRISRVIRPIFPILFVRDLRRQYYIVIAIVPYIIELIILWLIIAAIFARIAYHIFYHSEGNLIDGHTHQSVYMKNEFEQGLYPYNNKMSSYCREAENDATNSMKTCDEFFDDFVWNSFSTFFKSLISSFALLTTETFPDVWWPTWLSNDGKPYWTFFLIYALIAVFFLLNLFSAAVYDAYLHIVSKIDVIEEKRETQALKVAWICLDTLDSGCIGPSKFENLMYRLKPEYTEFEIGVIFKLMDPDNNHLIDAEDFSILMINMLYLRISRKTRSKEDELKLYLQKLGGSCPYGYEILRAFTSQTWRYCMLFIQIIDICALLSYHQYPKEMNVIDFICIVIILFAFIIDVIFKHMSKISTYFKSSRNRLYFGLTIIQTIGTFIGIINDREWISALRFFGILRMLIVGVFALEKIKYLRTSLTRTLTQTVISMIPVFLRIVAHISVVLLYIYTIIGIELFVDPNTETHGQSRCSAPQQLLNNPYALFCDAQMTIITLTQILTTNNWHIIMYTAIQITDNWFISLYFITFFFFGPILVVTYLLAMFFNMFFVSAAESETDLSAFFHETDASAKELQHHMELQEIRQFQTQQFDEFNNDYPKEIGMHELPNGQKILTVRRPIQSTPGVDNELKKPLLQNNDTENPEPEPAIEQETELIHIPLYTVCRQLWDNLPGEDWLSEDGANTFKNTFNGRDACNYLISAGFAPDAEDAVDYLAVIMDDINPFMRVDVGKEQEFENNEDSHYQWIIVPDDDDELNENDQVALEDITIGYRHSYGGYHRLLKEYRQAGIDPSQAAAQRNAAQLRANNQQDTPTVNNENTSPVANASPTGNDNDNNNDDLNAANSASDLVSAAEKGIKHLRNQSAKILQDIVKKKINSPIASPVSPPPNNNNNEYDDNKMAESDDEEKQIVPEFEQQDGNNNNNKLPYSTSVTNLNKNNKNNKKGVELTSFTPTTNMHKAQSHNDMTHQLHNDNAYDNEAEDTIAPLGKFGSGAPPGLQKSKSVKGISGKPGGLNRSLSSKMILLRHLDNKPKKVQ